MSGGGANYVPAPLANYVSLVTDVEFPNVVPEPNHTIPAKPVRVWVGRVLSTKSKTIVVQAAWKTLTAISQIIMAATQSLSEYQQAAAAKWPHYNITGDGPHALVCPTSYSVTLFGWWFDAACAMMNDHSNWRCRNQHKLEELKPLPRRAPATRNFAERIERD